MSRCHLSTYTGPRSLSPNCLQLLVVLVMLGRLCATLLLSFQLVPFPTSFETVLRLRTEALLEVMVINTMEYVSVCMPDRGLVLEEIRAPLHV